MKAIVKLLISFKYAFSGLLFCVKTCRNFRIHTVAAAVVIYFSTFFDFSGVEQAVLYFTIGLVLAFECVNTAIEQICNNVSRDFSPFIKFAKDAAAASVLCTAIASVAVAICLFSRSAVFTEIFAYFSNPLRLLILVVAAFISIIYIFYEDIFRNGK